MLKRSPFPGMDPWLEQHWGDVHQRLITYACDAIQEKLPEDLRARMQERLIVESDDDSRSILPDVSVTEHPGPVSKPAAPHGPGTSVVEPLVLRLPDEPATQTFIEIIEAKSGARVVTIVEFLSPVNKLPGPGRRLYKRKQREAREASVSLVEIDLLRDGERVFVAPLGLVPPSRRTPYYASIWRSWDPLDTHLYPIPLAARLPDIPVPLREADAPAAIPLQEVLDRAYHFGRYDRIDYRLPPEPPLTAAEAEWAEPVIRAARGS